MNSIKWYTITNKQTWDREYTGAIKECMLWINFDCVDRVFKSKKEVKAYLRNIKWLKFRLPYHIMILIQVIFNK